MGSKFWKLIRKKHKSLKEIKFINVVLHLQRNGQTHAKHHHSMSHQFAVNVKVFILYFSHNRHCMVFRRQKKQLKTMKTSEWTVASGIWLKMCWSSQTREIIQAKKKREHFSVWQTLSCYCLESFPQLGHKSLIWIINESQEDDKRWGVRPFFFPLIFVPLWGSCTSPCVTSANILLLNFCCFLFLLFLRGSVSIQKHFFDGWNKKRKKEITNIPASFTKERYCICMRQMSTVKSNHN